MNIFESIEHNSLTRKKVIFLLALLILLITILEIWSMNRLSTYGLQISQLERTKQSLTLENQVLENEIARRASLNKIEGNATYYGFSQVKKVEYMKVYDLALHTP